MERGAMTDPGDRYSPHVERLVASVLGPSGHTGTELRRAALARAARLAGCRDALGWSSGGVPPSLGGYVDKVARHAYQVSDEDVAALQRAGSADDAIFEITVAAAVGAALGRLERGLSALRGEER
jgi:hypothetical protein